MSIKSTPRGILFTKKNMPAKVYRKLLKLQSDYKNDCGCQVSLERTVYKIIEER